MRAAIAGLARVGVAACLLAVSGRARAEPPQPLHAQSESAPEAQPRHPAERPTRGPRDAERDPSAGLDVALALGSPYAPTLRRYYYDQLSKHPARALGWELLFPGAGGLYTGIYAPAACALALSLGGASMWVAGALRERPAVMWTGIATFAAGRAVGLIGAPVGALLLNAAFRQQLQLVAAF